MCPEEHFLLLCQKEEKFLLSIFSPGNSRNAIYLSGLAIRAKSNVLKTL